MLNLLRNLVVGNLGGHLVVHHVLLEGGSNLEHLSTLVALELLDVGVVQLAVLPQIALLAEAQAASLADEGLLSRVGPHVRGEDLPGSKLLFAKLALETEHVGKLDVPISQTVRSEPAKDQKKQINQADLVIFSPNLSLLSLFCPR